MRHRLAVAQLLVSAAVGFAAAPGSAWQAQPQVPDAAARIFDQYSKSVLVLIVRGPTGEKVGSGTGFVVSGGRIVTNEHVARGGNVVVDLGAVVVRTRVERVDATNDLAVLVPDGEVAARPLALAQRIPDPGVSVFVIGNPQGLERTISTGIVSAIRTFDSRPLLQITAPISPGSSGSPVMNAAGEVVGVTVGMLSQGQNLNFAVPVPLLRQLLAGAPSPGATSAASLLQRAQTLVDEQKATPFSRDDSSPWQELDRQIDVALQAALDHAGTDADVLLRIATLAESQNTDIAISAADRSVRARPSAEGQLVLAKGLQLKTLFVDDASQKGPLLQRAEAAARAALRTSKPGNAQAYFVLADVLEDRQSFVEADANFRLAWQYSNTAADADLRSSIQRGLVRTSFALGKQAEGKAWFKALADSGKATTWDWVQDGKRHDEVREYGEAGKSYTQAALLGGSWTNWCEAAGSFFFVAGQEENALFTARKCLSEGSGKKDSEARLAEAHRNIASILHQRGVYEEALSHAREAVVLNPNDAFAYGVQAQALLSLQRYQEAINAAKQAIRLSDGKYATDHFTLGSAYFQTENWQFAQRSFEKASELAPADTAAPYNVAVCLTRLGYYRDAARWYEEVLRRNPSHPDRQDLLTRIQTLRR